MSTFGILIMEEIVKIKIMVIRHYTKFFSSLFYFIVKTTLRVVITPASRITKLRLKELKKFV